MPPSKKRGAAAVAVTNGNNCRKACRRSRRHPGPKPSRCVFLDDDTASTASTDSETSSFYPVDTSLTRKKSRGVGGLVLTATSRSVRKKPPPNATTESASRTEGYSNVSPIADLRRRTSVANVTTPSKKNAATAAGIRNTTRIIDSPPVPAEWNSAGDGGRNKPRAATATTETAAKNPCVSTPINEKPAAVTVPLSTSTMKHAAATVATSPSVAAARSAARDDALSNMRVAPAVKQEDNVSEVIDLSGEVSAESTLPQPRLLTFRRRMDLIEATLGTDFSNEKTHKRIELLEDDLGIEDSTGMSRNERICALEKAIE